VSERALPCPPLPIRVDLPGDRAQPPDLSALPRRPGVFAFVDDAGRTITMAVTADLRRLVRARLAPPDEDAGPTRRIDYRSVTRAVCATTVGSAFEADWAYLQLARTRLPATYGTLLDRWRGWFIHCDPAAPAFAAAGVIGTAISTAPRPGCGTSDRQDHRAQHRVRERSLDRVDRQAAPARTRECGPTAGRGGLSPAWVAAGPGGRSRHLTKPKCAPRLAKHTQRAAGSIL